MNNLPKQLIIIGGGSSIKQGISLGLSNKIQNKFVICCNWAITHFDGTINTFIDSTINDKNILEYYKGQKKFDSYFVENLSNIKRFPLCIGLDTGNIEKPYRYSNILFIKGRGEAPNNFKEGIRTGALTGVFSLSLAVNLMPENSTIFLLGFDFNRKSQNPNAKTHYYDNIVHRGRGFFKYYEEQDPAQIFNFYKRYPQKIYNVNPNSLIPTFEKIDYPTFFNKLNKDTFDQTNLRNNIRQTIKEKIK